MKSLLVLSLAVLLVVCSSLQLAAAYGVEGTDYPDLHDDAVHGKFRCMACRIGYTTLMEKLEKNGWPTEADAAHHAVDHHCSTIAPEYGLVRGADGAYTAEWALLSSGKNVEADHWVTDHFLKLCTLHLKHVDAPMILTHTPLNPQWECPCPGDEDWVANWDIHSDDEAIMRERKEKAAAEAANEDL